MATPLPPSTMGTGALYNPSSAATSSLQQAQPRTSPIAHFASLPNDGIGNDSLKSKLLSGEEDGIPTSGRLLAVNSSYIAYTVKKGLIRVIDRKSASKTLLRGHDETTRPVDAAFFGETIGGKEGVGGVIWEELASLKRGGGVRTAGGNKTKTPLPPAAASDVLATLGGAGDSARILIWRIHTSSNIGGSSSAEGLGADKLLEVRFPHATRVIWHPFNPNRFLLLHRNLGTNWKPEEGAAGRAVATLVETTRLVTRPHETDGHMVCDCKEKDGSIPGMIPLNVEGSGDELLLEGANDIAWSNRDARHVITGHDDGFVRLWDLTSTKPGSEGGVGGGAAAVPCVAKLDVASNTASENKRVTRVIFLSQYEGMKNVGGGVTPPFLTGTDMNHTITLWSSFPSSAGGGIGSPSCLRVFGLRNNSNSFSLSNMLSLELIPAPYRPPLQQDGIEEITVPSSFLLMAERTSGTMHALHLSTEWKSEIGADGTTLDAAASVSVKGFDHVSTLNVVHPIYSFCVAPTPSSSGGGMSGSNALKEERDVEICCIQSKAVQMLTLSADILALDEDSTMVGGDLAPGLTLLDLPAEVSDEDEEVMEEEEFEEEEYDMEEEGAEYSTNDSGDDDDNEDDDEEDGVPTATESEPNAFSNWLGAIANPLPPPTTSAGAPPVAAAAPSAPKASPPPGLGFSSILPPPPGMAPTSSSAPPPPPPPATNPGMTFLSPMQILSGSGSADLELPKKQQPQRESSPMPPPVAPPGMMSSAPPPSVPVPVPSKAPKKSGKKNAGKKAAVAAATAATNEPTAPMKILQREGQQPKEEPSRSSIQNAAAGATVAVDLASIEAAIERSISAHMKSHETALLDSVRNLITAEVNQAVQSSLKETSKATEQAVQRGIASGLTSSLGTALDGNGKLSKRLEKHARESAASAAKEAVDKMQGPIVNSLHQTMREVMIPAYEAATRQMFQQTSTTLERGLAQMSVNQTNASAPQLQAMSAQMMKMSEAITSLSTEVSQLRALANAGGMMNQNGNMQQQQQQGGAGGVGSPPPMGIRDEIKALCQAKRYEEAFTKAVSASDGDIVLFACKNADAGAVFNGEGGVVSVSQPILICLMQQLGAVLVTASDAGDIKVILSWLQEIAVTIDPTNMNIQRHVGSVVQQLLANINNKMSNCDPAFRRPLQTLMQVIRGLL